MSETEKQAKEMVVNYLKAVLASEKIKGKIELSGKAIERAKNLRLEITGSQEIMTDPFSTHGPWGHVDMMVVPNSHVVELVVTEEKAPRKLGDFDIVHDAKDENPPKPNAKTL